MKKSVFLAIALVTGMFLTGCAKEQQIDQNVKSQIMIENSSLQSSKIESSNTSSAYNSSTFQNQIYKYTLKAGFDDTFNAVCNFYKYYDGWIYYNGESGIYRVKPDLTQKI